MMFSKKGLLNTPKETIDCINQQHAGSADGMSPEEFVRYKEIYEPVCYNFVVGNCDGHGPYCGNKLEADHVFSKHLGGSDRIPNRRPLCKSANSAKQNRQNWFKHKPNNFFESEINEAALRDKQRDALATIDKCRELFEGDMTKVLSHFIGIFASTGMGKTLMATTAIMRIASIRAQLGHKQINRVLWMVHDRGIVDKIAGTSGCPGEIVKDLNRMVEVNGNMVCATPEKPTISSVNHWSDWGECADTNIVVACPQALWVQDGSDDEAFLRMKMALNSFDVIVLDEAQFAIERWKQIFRYAPHAIKIIMTATPMTADGSIWSVNHDKPWIKALAQHISVLIAEDCMFDRSVFKNLVDYENGVRSKFYIPVSGFNQEDQVGEKTSEEEVIANTARARSIVNKTLEICNANGMEDAHAIITTNGVQSLKQVSDIIKEKNFPHTCVYSGRSADRLAGNDWFQKHENPDGECGRRVMLVVDMGQFGLNNHYCLVMAWVSDTESVIDVIQRIGRALRALSEKKMEKAALGQIENGQPIVRLVFPAASERVIKRAIEIILNFGSLVKDHFKGQMLFDLLTAENDDVVFSDIEKKLSNSDKGVIDAALSEHLAGLEANEEGEISDVEIARVVDIVRPNVRDIDSKIDEVVDRIRKQVEDPNVRKITVAGVTSSYKQRPGGNDGDTIMVFPDLRSVSHEDPNMAVTDEDVEHYIQNHEEHADLLLMVLRGNDAVQAAGLRAKIADKIVAVRREAHRPIERPMLPGGSGKKVSAYMLFGSPGKNEDRHEMLREWLPGGGANGNGVTYPKRILSLMEERLGKLPDTLGGQSIWSIITPAIYDHVEMRTGIKPKKEVCDSLEDKHHDAFFSLLISPQTIRDLTVSCRKAILKQFIALDVIDELPPAWQDYIYGFWNVIISDEMNRERYDDELLNLSIVEAAE